MVSQLSPEIQMHLKGDTNALLPVQNWPLQMVILLLRQIKKKGLVGGQNSHCFVYLQMQICEIGFITQIIPTRVERPKYTSIFTYNLG
jgi:hypothetical protein